MASYPTPRAVVLTTEQGVFYDNGRTHPLSEQNRKLDDLGGLLAGAVKAFRGGEGVVLIDAPAPFPATTSLEHAQHEIWRERLGDGWTFTPLRAWTEFTPQQGGIQGAPIKVGWLPELVRTNKLGPLLDGHQGPADLAWRLGRYHQLVGVPWTYTAGVSGCAAIRAQYNDPRPGKQPLWHWHVPKGVRGAGPLIWRAALQPHDLNARVHVFDVNAMYLAGVRNAKVAWGSLAKYDGAFDPSWAGFWEIDVSRIPSNLLDGHSRPPLIPPAQIHKGAALVSTPMAKLVMEQVGTLDVLDALVAENTAPIGRKVAERLMAARNGDLGPTGPAQFAIKRTYAELVGMVARGSGSIDRADWAAAWQDTARANMLRRVDKVGHKLKLWPVAVQTDAVYYTGNASVDEIAAVLGVGTSPGLFKYVGPLTVAEYRAKFRLSA